MILKRERPKDHPHTLSFSKAEKGASPSPRMPLRPPCSGCLPSIEAARSVPGHQFRLDRHFPGRYSLGLNSPALQTTTPNRSVAASAGSGPGGSGRGHAGDPGLRPGRPRAKQPSLGSSVPGSPCGLAGRTASSQEQPSSTVGAGRAAAGAGGEQAASLPDHMSHEALLLHSLPPSHGGRARQSGLLECVTHLLIRLASAPPE